MSSSRSEKIATQLGTHFHADVPANFAAIAIVYDPEEKAFGLVSNIHPDATDALVTILKAAIKQTEADYATAPAVNPKH